MGLLVFWFCSFVRNRERTLQNARKLRRNLSPPELKLWLRLKSRQPGQPAFRCQHPMGPFVLDFYCARARLAIEIDGLCHASHADFDYDIRRSEWLRRQGLTVMRYTAADVFRDADEIATSLREAASRLAREREGLPLSAGLGEGDRL